MWLMVTMGLCGREHTFRNIVSFLLLNLVAFGQKKTISPTLIFLRLFFYLFQLLVAFKPYFLASFPEDPCSGQPVLATHFFFSLCFFGILLLPPGITWKKDEVCCLCPEGHWIKELHYSPSKIVQNFQRAWGQRRWAFVTWVNYWNYKGWT